MADLIDRIGERREGYKFFFWPRVVNGRLRWLCYMRVIERLREVPNRTMTGYTIRWVEEGYFDVQRMDP